VPVLAHDDEESLAARVLDAEHRIYPLAVRWLVEDRLRIDGGRVWLRDPAEGPQALACFDTARARGPEACA
jgi:phosphoribosylglycinamide formyltransferase-1